MSVSQKHIQQVRAEADCLFTAEQVGVALDDIAERISAKHRDNNPLVLCVMNGGLIVTAELMLRLDFPLEQDYLHATRYRGETTGGELRWLAEPKHSLKDRHVLVIDDILDEGYTLAAIAEHCQQAGAHSVETVALVEKSHDRKHGIKADYIGLEVEDRYLFGYGMDYKGYLRNAAGIFAVKGM
jgi:hypoxanthine phosphoribosyltransferase